MIIQFGATINRPDLAEVVASLYDAALQESSRKTYQTGQRAFRRFHEEIYGQKESSACLPFQNRNLGDVVLHLSFFMAWLLIQPTITSASTILGYETHTKYMFRSEGCKPWESQTAFLGQVRQGIKNVLPCQADKRKAFLLPHHMHLEEFSEVQASSRDQNLTRWATILGFVGMLRPHTFSQLKVKSFIFVITTKRKGKLRLTLREGGALLRRWRSSDILGYYVEFKSKTMPVARAYFPNLSTPGSHYSAMCPVKAIQILA